MNSNDIRIMDEIIELICKEIDETAIFMLTTIWERIKKSGRNCSDCQHTFKKQVVEDNTPLEGQVSIDE